MVDSTTYIVTNRSGEQILRVQVTVEQKTSDSSQLSAESIAALYALWRKDALLQRVFLWTIDSVLEQPVKRRWLHCQGKVSAGPDVSPALLSSCSFWDICNLSAQKGFPELICFPPYSRQIIIYLKLIHLSVHWSHMSYQQRERERGKKKEMEMLKGEDAS